MTFFDPERIRAHTFIECVEYHAQLESTNTLAVDLRSELHRCSPALVLADQQTAGRGRGGRTWWSMAGALTCSVVLDADQHGPAPESRPLVALATGLAVRTLVSELAPRHEVSIKWPNDVLIGDEKICGILSEQHLTDSGSVLIIGIGLNLNNSLASAPDDVRQRATSTFDRTGHSVDLTDTLNQLLNHLRSMLVRLRRHPTEIARQSEQFNRLTGHQVTVQTPTETLTGECTGIADDGALQLTVAGVVREIRAGSVLEFE
jgi:BirA family biotin operon repressor/biotin-[acetyl-CoA-carboxylase] ligase